MTKQILILWIFSLSTLGSSDLVAGIVIPPPGLHPGDHYRLAFVTSLQNGAYEDGIDFYNGYVNHYANANPELSALSSTWTIIGSTRAVNARTNTSTRSTDADIPIYNLRGQLVSATNDGLWDGRVNAPIAYDEFGNFHSIYVFTGTSWEGVTARALGDPFVSYGWSFSTASDWVINSQGRPEIRLSYYGISGDIVVPSAVPEPSSALLFGLVALGCGIAIFPCSLSGYGISGKPILTSVLSGEGGHFVLTGCLQRS